MKNILLTASLLCTMALSSFAQPTDYYNRMNHVFGAIDKGKVNTGLLKEFGVRLNEVEAYNGTISSTNWVDVTQWRSLYHSLYSMRVGTATSMTAPATVYSHLETQQNNNPNGVLLAAEYYTYNQYKTNAYTSGDVTVSNDRIYDVAGRNPYDIKTAFAVAPMEYHLKGNSFDFKLQSNMIYTNTNQTLSSVQVDFDNGQGYQTLSLNTLKNVTYASGGEKELKVKFTYSGGPTLYSHSKLYVDYSAPPPASARFNGSGATVTPITGAAYLGASATGDVTVELAPGHSELTKPLIVVEGFDPSDDFDYFDFINDPQRTSIGSIDILINGSGLTLNQAIEDEGYDLVFVNYRNGTDYIQRNAYMVEAVIEWVNNEKVGNEKNVVLGMSMGGLVARYALRHMETTGRTHETKLYISHDVPHQGANVPLAYQAFVRHLVGESIGLPVFFSLFTINIVDIEDLAPDLQRGLDLLQTPAAQQMLIYQMQGTGSSISIDNSTLHHSFSTEYRNLGYPVQGGIRHIAISNGSECGSPLAFGPNAALANINEKIDLPFFVTNIAFFLLNKLSVNPLRSLTSLLSTNTDIKAEFTMRALPDRQSKEVYKGKIFIKKKVLGFINVEEQLIDKETAYSSSSMLPLDNSGGGIYDINSLVSLPPEIAQFIIEPRFNFIPTYSSLDIGGGSQTIASNDVTRAYSPLAPPVFPKDTPFDNFYTNPVISENHIQFTLNNGNWLLDELQGTTGFYSCASECQQALTGVTISGPTTLCTSNQTFGLNNLISGQNVTWSVSPANLFAVDNGSGYQFTTRASNSGVSGQGRVSAIFQTDCGNARVDYFVWIGEPLTPISIDPGYNGVCSEQIIQLFVGGTDLENTDSYTYNWSFNGLTPTVTYESVNRNVIELYYCQTGVAYVNVSVSNSCGTSNSQSTSFNVSPCFGDLGSIVSCGDSGGGNPGGGGDGGGDTGGDDNPDDLPDTGCEGVFICLNSLEGSIDAYPVPASEELELEINYSESQMRSFSKAKVDPYNYQVELVPLNNPMGKHMKKVLKRSKEKINIREMKPGLYALIVQGHGERFRKVIVIE